MKKQTKLGLVLAAAALISVSVASLVSARGWVQEGAEWRYVGNDGEFVTDTIQTSGNAKFYLNEDGYMVKDYFLEDYDNANYYFGANGAMVTNTWVAIESGNVNNTKGDYTPDNYWYYFQASGKAVKGSATNPKKMTIDGKRYLFNEYGQMCVGWVNKEGETIDPDNDTFGGPFAEALYYAGGDNDGALRAGWVTYYDGFTDASDDQKWYDEKTTLYFYFNTNSNKKEFKDNDLVEKQINGKTYMFDSTGMMLSGWDYVDMKGFNKTKAPYFSGEDDGHKVKKGWVYAVPAENIDSGKYEDGEEKYFYFNGSGNAVTDQFKKINGKYYAFDNKGIMKTGLAIYISSSVATTAGNTPNKVLDTADLDWADGAQLAKAGRLFTDSNKYVDLHYDGTLKATVPSSADTTDTRYQYTTSNTTAGSGDQIQLHYFGDDGARKIGTNTINFADDAFTFVSTANGNKKSGESAKKFYSLGIQCKASSDIRFGIFNSDLTKSLTQQDTSYNTSLARSIDVDGSSTDAGDYVVLTTGGSAQSGSNTAKKDANDHYWLITKDKKLEGIFSVEVKRQKTTLSSNVKATISEFSSAPTSVGDDYYVPVSVMLDYAKTNADNEEFGITKKVYSVLFGSEKLLQSSLATGNADDDGVFILSPVTGTTGYYSITYNGYQFKSDSKDSDKSSQVWMAFGVNDNGNKTAELAYNASNPESVYQVQPDNDYFLNCYWDSSFPKTGN